MRSISHASPITLNISRCSPDRMPPPGGMARPGPAGNTVPQARFLTLLHCAAAAETEQSFMRTFHTLPPWQHRIKSCSVPSPENRRRPGVAFLIGEPQCLASLRAAPPGLLIFIATLAPFALKGGRVGRSANGTLAAHTSAALRGIGRFCRSFKNRPSRIAHNARSRCG